MQEKTDGQITDRLINGHSVRERMDEDGGETGSQIKAGPMDKQRDRKVDK